MIIASAPKNISSHRQEKTCTFRVLQEARRLRSVVGLAADLVLTMTPPTHVSDNMGSALDLWPKLSSCDGKELSGKLCRSQEAQQK